MEQTQAAKLTVSLPPLRTRAKRTLVANLDRVLSVVLDLHQPTSREAGRDTQCFGLFGESTDDRFLRHRFDIVENLLSSYPQLYHEFICIFGGINPGRGVPVGC